MSRMRRTLAVLVTVLLVAGAFASPVLAQTAVEEEGPYREPTPEEPEEGEEPEDTDDDTVVGGVEDDPDDVTSQPQVGEQEPDTSTVAGVTLQRTGANSLLIALAGLLILGIGGFLVARTRRSASEV